MVLALGACSGRDDGMPPGFDMPDSGRPTEDTGPELRMDATSDVTLPDAMPDAGDASDGASMCMGAVADAPFRDRRDDAEFTVPADCATCPGSFMNVTGLSDVAPTATTTMVQGTSMGSQTCEVYVEGSSCGVVRATALLDPDGTGLFVSTVPLFCGENIVRVVCSNSAGQRVLVRRFMGTECENGRDLRVTLSWGEEASDMELHLINPMGRINDRANDCTWFTCMSGALDWGVMGDATDNPTKDIDDTGTLGPENIFLESAPSGMYDIMVEYWGSGPPAGATVAIAINETTVATLDVTDFKESHVWHVGRVVFPTGRFIETNRIINCEMDWQTGMPPMTVDEGRGCNMDIPLRE